jgi:hypothetical protein
VAGVVIAIGAVAFPVWALFPVRGMREQGGYLSTVQQACDKLGPRAAVVMLDGAQLASDNREDWIAQTLRSWCGVPVASLILNGDTNAELARLATRWSNLDRKLYVVATGETPIHQVEPDAEVTPITAAANGRLLTQTFTHRPAHYETQSFPLFIGSVPANGAQ